MLSLVSVNILDYIEWLLAAVMYPPPPIVSAPQLFLECVPRFLGMSSLVDDGQEEALPQHRRSSFGLMQRAEEYVLKQSRSEMIFNSQRERHGLTNTFGESAVNGSYCSAR